MTESGLSDEPLVFGLRASPDNLSFPQCLLLGVLGHPHEQEVMPRGDPMPCLCPGGDPVSYLCSLLGPVCSSGVCLPLGRDQMKQNRASDMDLKTRVGLDRGIQFWTDLFLSGFSLL